MKALSEYIKPKAIDSASGVGFLNHIFDVTDDRARSLQELLKTYDDADKSMLFDKIRAGETEIELDNADYIAGLVLVADMWQPATEAEMLFVSCIIGHKNEQWHNFVKMLKTAIMMAAILKQFASEEDRGEYVADQLKEMLKRNQN